MIEDIPPENLLVSRNKGSYHCKAATDPMNV